MEITEPMLHQGIRHNCAQCAGFWGECTCGHVDSEGDLGFGYYEFFITNPWVSECGRFFVDPTVYYGLNYTKWVGTDNHRQWLEAVKASEE